jgi:hypothetical protein
MPTEGACVQSFPPVAHDPDVLAHIVERFQDIIIPEAQHKPTLCVQPFCPAGVAGFCCIRCMLPAVQFDNDLAFDTGEVHDERADRMLSPEAKAHQPVRAQLMPQA